MVPAEFIISRQQLIKSMKHQSLQRMNSLRLCTLHLKKA